MAHVRGYFDDIAIAGADLSAQPCKQDHDTVTYTFSTELPPQWYAAFARHFRDLASRPIMRIPEMRPRHDEPRRVDLFVRREADADEFARINDYIEQAADYANAEYRVALARAAGGTLSHADTLEREATRVAQRRAHLRRRFPCT